MKPLKTDYAESTLRKYARSESLERDIEGDGAAIYLHNDRLMHPCDYACNGRTGEIIAQQINELEDRLGYKMLRPEDEAEMKRAFLAGAEKLLEKMLLDGFLVHYLSCTRDCESEQTLIAGARQAHIDDEALYDLALRRVGDYMGQNKIKIVRGVPMPRDLKKKTAGRSAKGVK